MGLPVTKLTRNSSLRTPINELALLLAHFSKPAFPGMDANRTTVIECTSGLLLVHFVNDATGRTATYFYFTPETVRPQHVESSESIADGQWLRYAASEDRFHEIGAGYEWQEHFALYPAEDAGQAAHGEISMTDLLFILSEAKTAH